MSLTDDILSIIDHTNSKAKFMQNYEWYSLIFIFSQWPEILINLKKK